MRPIRLLALVLLLGLAACAAPSGSTDMTSILIDQPTPPFPYNSRICP